MHLFENLQDLKLGPHLQLADTVLNLFSVFDDLKYDRADADMLTPSQRQHVIKKLTPFGFKQKTGTILEHGETDTRCFFPKFHALGASPFDITRFTAKREQDYYILTPTQTACQFIDNYPHMEAVDRVRELIKKQPINLYRLMDYLEHKPAHREFLNAIGHLKFIQREAVESEPLCYMRALG